MSATRATRQDRYRRRHANGRIVISLEIDAQTVIEELIAFGLIRRDQENDRKAITAAVQRHYDLIRRV